jgi:hypothetical protein
MAVQLSTGVRTAMAAAIETTVGTSPLLRIYSGAQPANCAAAASGTLLAEMALPSDWSTQASGVLTMAGTWQDASANNAGTAGHYRLTDTAGTTCHEQGNVTATGGGGDLTLDNTSIAAAQVVTVTSWTRTVAGA